MNTISGTSYYQSSSRCALYPLSLSSPPSGSSSSSPCECTNSNFSFPLSLYPHIFTIFSSSHDPDISLQQQSFNLSHLWQLSSKGWLHCRLIVFTKIMCSIKYSWECQRRGWGTLRYFDASRIRMVDPADNRHTQPSSSSFHNCNQKYTNEPSTSFRCQGSYGRTRRSRLL